MKEKTDFTQALFRLDGEEITTGGETCPRCGTTTQAEVLTLRRACVDALLMPSQDDAKLSGTKRLQRFLLARKLTDGDNLELTVDEKKTVIDLVPRRWSTLVYGNVVMMLDPVQLQQANDE